GGGDPAAECGSTLGENSQPRTRRRSNNAQVPEPRKTRRQRARYRRGAHPKSMNALRKTRNVRLLRRTKMLLLIDNDETEVGKPHVSRGESLCADNDFQFAATEFFFRISYLRCRCRPRQVRHFDSKGAEPLAKRLDMLSGQDGGRNRNSDLFS